MTTGWRPGALAGAWMRSAIALMLTTVAGAPPTVAVVPGTNAPSRKKSPPPPAEPWLLMACWIMGVGFQEMLADWRSTPTSVTLASHGINVAGQRTVTEPGE